MTPSAIAAPAAIPSESTTFRVNAAPVGLVPGENAVIDVVIRNLDVGHRFPGGVMDAQDTWV